MAEITTIQDSNQRYDEVLHLQKSLSKFWVSERKREEIGQKVAEIFENVSSYEEMCTLRERIEGSHTGTSLLHRLVYRDVNPQASQRILRAINANVNRAYLENPAQIKFSYMVYSDIDDTIKGTLNDLKSGVSGYYPSVFEFYNEVSQADQDLPTAKKVHLTFLSARPDIVSNFWNLLLRRNLPNEVKFYSLYGSLSAFLNEVKRRIINFVAVIAIKVLPNKLASKIKESREASETRNFISIALDKRQNIDRDLLLRPEVRPIMVGDCGEGDLIFLLMKNSGVPIPVDDERIPEEYVGEEKWTGSLDTPGNPTHKPLFLGFAHALSSHSGYEGIKLHPDYHEEYLQEFNTLLFSNYVETTLHCVEKGIINKAAADQIVEKAREWKESQMDTINQLLLDRNIDLANALQEETLKTLPANLRYRLKLIRSIEAYDRRVL